MIDSKLILSDKEFVKRELSKKNFDTNVIDELEKLLLHIRVLKRNLNELCKKRRELNADIDVSADDKRAVRARISSVEKRSKNLKLKPVNFCTSF